MLVLGGTPCGRERNVCMQQMASELEQASDVVVTHYTGMIAQASSIRELEDVLIAMAIDGLNIVSSDGVRVFSTVYQLKRLRIVAEGRYGDNIPYNLFNRTLGLRQKIMELVECLNSESQ